MYVCIYIYIYIYISMAVFLGGGGAAKIMQLRGFRTPHNSTMWAYWLLNPYIFWKSLKRAFRICMGLGGNVTSRKIYGPRTESSPGISQPILAKSGDFPWFCRMRARPGRDWNISLGWKLLSANWIAHAKVEIKSFCCILLGFFWSWSNIGSIFVAIWHTTVKNLYFCPLRARVPNR